MRHEDAIPDPVAEVMEICQAMTVLINHLIQVHDESGFQAATMLRQRLLRAARELDDDDWRPAAVNE